LKPLDAFYKMPDMRDGHRNECKACNLQQKHQRYAADPAKEIRRVGRWRKRNAQRYADYQKKRRSRPEVKAADRAGHLKRKFGLTPAEYEAKLAAQGGGCALCGREPTPDRQLDIDHDHRTGAVRGLVCNRCNQGLGQFGDDPICLAHAAAYLLHWERPENPLRVRLLIGG
jgi:Recombination endonuclease VII